MNAAFLLMSSAALAGADVAPPPAPAPAVISSGAGCSNCGAPAVAPCGDCGKAKIGLLDKLKARLGGLGKKSHDCGCAPAPAPCDPCATAAARPNLLERLKGRLGHKKCHTCGPVCDPCGGAATVLSSPPVTGAPPAVANPSAPKEMPKPKDAAPPKGGVLAPVPPITGASGLADANSPY